MTYLTEFPDFDPSTMPAIPAHWQDISWHNDTCPSFQIGASLAVMVDYADAAQREHPESPRFSIHPMEDGTYLSDSFSLLDSDDWSEVLTMVAEKEGEPEALAYLKGLGFAEDHQSVSLYHPSGWNIHASHIDGSGYPSPLSFAVVVFGPDADCEEEATLALRNDDGVTFEVAVQTALATMRAATMNGDNRADPLGSVHTATARGATLPQIGQIAARFATILQAALDPAQWEEMRQRNAAQRDPSICHSHDYCDANMPMDGAFVAVMGRSPDPTSWADASLWGAAWAVAKAQFLTA